MKQNLDMNKTKMLVDGWNMYMDVPDQTKERVTHFKNNVRGFEDLLRNIGIELADFYVFSCGREVYLYLEFDSSNKKTFEDSKGLINEYLKLSLPIKKYDYEINTKYRVDNVYIELTLDLDDWNAFYPSIDYFYITQ